jgi:hypothetical protein
MVKSTQNIGGNDATATLGGPAVRRVFVQAVIKSINPEYTTYERDAEEVNIVGRVIWAARRI